GNEKQVRDALEGRTGLSKEVEDELIRRVAIAEIEQDTYESLSKANWWILAGSGIVGIILAIISFL
ncbi:MAG: hypothetical protein Q4B78_02880, partial [Bacillota bacterium]|nr:hypothetical protein [Bacillota bacterium]